jgi:hypothetical protein
MKLFVLISTMKNNFYLLCFYFKPLQFCFSKVSGIVVDKADQPVPLQI